MPRTALPIILAAAVLAAAPASASALDEQGYWAFADRMQARIDRYWDDRAGLYTGFSSGAHADVLLTLSVAARRGHEGAARNDRRARRLVDALVSRRRSSATRRPREGRQTHAPGFVSSMRRHRSGTSTSWSTARSSTGSATPGSPAASSASRTRSPRAIADRIHRTAMGSYWRWPAIRLNQINWYALVYAANATVTGSPRLLRHDLRLQIERFAARARGRGGRRRQLRAGAALQLPAALAAGRVDEHRLGRVREHHRLVHARVRAGAAARACGPRRPPRGGCCASG